MPRPCVALNGRITTFGHRTSSWRHNVSYGSSRRSFTSHAHCSEADAILPDIRNIVTTSLDVPDLEVYQSLVDSINHMRLWLCTHGDEIDFRIIGLERKMYTMPHTGTFHLILKKGLASLDLLFDARNGWVYGVICPKGIFLFKDYLSSDPYITHPAAHVLSFSGDYANIAPDSIANLRLGIQSLRRAFDVLVNFDGRTKTPEVRSTFGCLVVSFSETSKFHNVYNRVCTIMQKGGVETVGDSEPGIALEVKKWKKFSSIAVEKLHLVSQGLPYNKQPLLLTRKIAGINSVAKIVDNIFLVPYTALESKMLLRYPPRVPYTWCPIDEGVGDDKVYLLGDFDHSSLSSLSRKRFLRDNEEFIGDRAGGKPHESIDKLIITPSDPSWTLDLPIHHVGKKFPPR